jgi:hypothetical protein
MKDSNQHCWIRRARRGRSAAFAQRVRLMLIAVCRLYDSYADASRVVLALEAAGFPPSETSMISNNSDAWYSATKTASVAPKREDGPSRRADGKVEAAAIGATIGATAATAASLVTMLAIPGVGAVVGVGWLAAVLGSMAIGGVARRLAWCADQCWHQRGRRAGFRRGRAPRRNAGRGAGTAERIAANRGDDESVRGEASGTLRALPQVRLAVF